MAHDPTPIAIFLPNLAHGGAQRALADLANGLGERGHAVDFLVCRGGGGFETLLGPRVNLVNLNGQTLVGSFKPLRRYLTEVMPGAVLGGTYGASLCVAAASRGIGKSIRIIAREANTLSALLDDRPAHYRTVVGTLVRRVYPLCDRIVAVSQGVKDDLVRNFGMAAARIAVIRNAIDYDDILAASRSAEDDPFFADDGRPRLLAAGRLVRAKGFDVLIEALARVGRSLPFRAVILGEGPERASLDEAIARTGLCDGIRMPGFKANPFPWFAAADVFVLSSRFEGMPNALVQALFLGARVVATDCRSGPRELLDGREGLGCLVPVENAEEMARAIEAALRQGRDADHATERREIIESFSPCVTLRQYEEILA